MTHFSIALEESNFSLKAWTTVDLENNLSKLKRHNMQEHQFLPSRIDDNTRNMDKNKHNQHSQ